MTLPIKRIPLIMTLALAITACSDNKPRPQASVPEPTRSKCLALFVLHLDQTKRANSLDGLTDETSKNKRSEAQRRVDQYSEEAKALGCEPL